MKTSFKKNSWWIVLIAVILAINFVASRFHYRVDLTDEKRFTISQPVKNILAELDDKMEVLIFLKGDLPSGFRKLAATSQELLQEFEEFSNGNIQYRLISPEELIESTGRTYADTLSSMGMIPINLKVQLQAGEQSQYIYPAAIIQYKGNIQTVDLYSGTKTIITPPELNSAEALLEYNFANAIQKLTKNTRPMIAYATGHGQPQGAGTFDLVENVLMKDYSIFTVNLTQEKVIPDTFKLLLIVKPTVAFSESEKLTIDQYIMNGGKVLMLLDRLEAEMDSLQIKNQVIAYDRNLNLNDLLFRYGVRINPDLLMDLQCDFLPFSVNAQGQFEFLRWNYFPLFESPQNHVINKNLGLVAGRFVNSIDTVSAPGIRKTILLSSSDNSRTIQTPALISGTENRNAPVDEQYQQKNISAAVLLEGKFSSFYNNRISQAQRDSLIAIGSPFIGESVNDNKMIIIGDGDMALNGMLQGEPLPMGVNSYTVGSQYEYQFANKQFIENCIEYLVNVDGLIEAKSKDYTLRLLDSKKTADKRAFYQVLNLAAPLLLILLFGMSYQWWRKRKYA